MTKQEKQLEARKAIHRQFEGVVVSVKENKTIHVKVDAIKIHPKYRKQYKESKKYAVHDEKNEAVEGNIVVFQECRPMSKTKRWFLVKIVK